MSLAVRRGCILGWQLRRGRAPIPRGPKRLPDYYRAAGALARVLAARANLSAATEQAESAVRILPDQSFLAQLGDLYKLTGRERDASAQYALIEKIAHLSEINGVLYNRQLALFYADHDMKSEVAYELASKEYKVRRDIWSRRSRLDRS